MQMCKLRVEGLCCASTLGSILSAMTGSTLDLVAGKYRVRARNAHASQRAPDAAKS
jgi:hypothetical protein